MSEGPPHTLVARVESDGLGLQNIWPQLVVLRVGVVALALGDGHRQVRLQPRHDRVGTGPRRRLQGVNSIDIINFGHEIGHKTGPCSGPNSVLGHYKFRCVS